MKKRYTQVIGGREIKAKDILDQFWDGSLPVDILDIANKFGLSVRYLDREDEIIYSAKYESDASVCYINKNDLNPRQRFTLAHVLAHHVLKHGKSLRDTDRSMHSNDEKEREASVFAVNLLIPDNAIENLISNGLNEPIELANIFNVPVSALRIKFEFLGYL